jgi:hypothetical protein
MAGPDEIAPRIRRVQPHQLGWLRRPELDTPTVNVWEEPDGQLYAARKGKPLVLHVWRDQGIVTKAIVTKA